MKNESNYKKVVVFFIASILLISFEVALYGNKDSHELLDAQYKTALEILSDVPGITNLAASEFLGIRKSNPEINTAAKIKNRVNDGIHILKSILEKGYEPQGINYVLGAAYVRLLDREAAIECFRASMEKEPKRKNAYVDLLQLFWDKNDAESAQEVLKRYKTYFPGNEYEYHFFKAVTFQRAKNYASAILEAEQALKNNPNAADARFALGAAYLYSGDATRADEQFKWAVKLAPKFITQVEEFKLNWEKRQ